MSPEEFLRRMMRPGLHELAEIGGPAVSPLVERILLAIALQESDIRARFQGSPASVAGPARGWWQFEVAGCMGVLQHRASRELAQRMCERHHIVPHAAALHRALEGHDTMAAAIARLLLWTEPRALPTTAEQGWEQYIRNWRPGRPSQHRWGERWRTAHAATH